MTFFYDLNKKLAGLVQLNEGKSKPDFLDVDKDGDKEEPMKKALKDKIKEVEESTGDYSAKKARAGKDIGKPGKNFAKIAKDAAERYGSKERGEKVAGAVLAKLRKGTKEDLTHGLEEEATEEGNAFTAKLKATPKGGKFKLGDKEFKDTSSIEEEKAKNAFDPEFAKTMYAGDKGKTKTGHEVKDTGYSKRYTKSYDEEPEADDDNGEPKKKGRKVVGAGKGKKIGAKHAGTSKLHRKASIAEDDAEEYGMEGDKAKKDLKSVAMAAKELHGILNDEQDLPEWVQDKITRALDYINSTNQYMHQEMGDVEPVAEKAPPGKKAERMVKHIKQAYAKDGKLTDKEKAIAYATTWKAHKEGKVEEETGNAKSAPKGKKGMEFGKGVYEGMDDQVEQLISESINVSVNVTKDESGEEHKSLTVSAEGADAERLAEILKLAGVGGGGCPQCGSTPCGCAEVELDEVDENDPTWPTDTETSNDAFQYAGGLNKPKSTGQTTIPVVNRDPRRGAVGPIVAEEKDLGMNLYKELQSFKEKK